MHVSHNDTCVCPPPPAAPPHPHAKAGDGGGWCVRVYHWVRNWQLRCFQQLLQQEGPIGPSLAYQQPHNVTNILRCVLLLPWLQVPTPTCWIMTGLHPCMWYVVCQAALAGLVPAVWQQSWLAIKPGHQGWPHCWRCYGTGYLWCMHSYSGCPLATHIHRHHIYRALPLLKT